MKEETDVNACMYILYVDCTSLKLLNSTDICLLDSFKGLLTRLFSWTAHCRWYWGGGVKGTIKYLDPQTINKVVFENTLLDNDNFYRFLFFQHNFRSVKNKRKIKTMTWEIWGRHHMIKIKLSLINKTVCIQRSQRTKCLIQDGSFETSCSESSLS